MTACKTAQRLARSASFWPMLTEDEQREFERVILLAAVRGILAARVELVGGVRPMVVRVIE